MAHPLFLTVQRTEKVAMAPTRFADVHAYERYADVHAYERYADVHAYERCAHPRT